MGLVVVTPDVGVDVILIVGTIIVVVGSVTETLVVGVPVVGVVGLDVEGGWETVTVVPAPVAVAVTVVDTVWVVAAGEQPDKTVSTAKRIIEQRRSVFIF
jgi:hypothetical protein